MDICEIVAVARCTIPTCLFDLSLSLEWYTIRKLHTILIILFSCFFLQPCRSLIAHTHTHMHAHRFLSYSFGLCRSFGMYLQFAVYMLVRLPLAKYAFSLNFLCSPLSLSTVSTYVYVCQYIVSNSFHQIKKKRQFVWNRERIGAIETVHLFENQDNDNDTNSDIEFKEHNLNKLANVSWDFFSEIILKISRIVPPVINCTQ